MRAPIEEQLEEPGDDVEADAVHASVQKISLRCCITLKPLVDPAKGVCCTHPATANFADLAAAWTAQL